MTALWKIVLYAPLILGSVGPALAQPATPQSGQPGMVIKGGGEGPQGLFVAPWQEPSLVVPDVLTQSQLPLVFDFERSLVESPVNKEVPDYVKAVQAPPSAVAKQAPPVSSSSRRRSRGQHEVQRPTIMQSPVR